eukprot:9829559-Lingulodinium_polyedra.AAC.1
MHCEPQRRRRTQSNAFQARRGARSARKCGRIRGGLGACPPARPTQCVRSEMRRASRRGAARSNASPTA